MAGLVLVAVLAAPASGAAQSPTAAEATQPPTAPEAAQSSAAAEAARPSTADEPLTLLAAVDAALGGHPSIVAVRARAAGADAAITVARAARLPRLRLDAGASRFAEPMPVAPIHGFDPAELPVFDRTLYQSDISLAYTVFDGGERGARIDRARAVARGAEAAADDAGAALLANVARAYLGVSSGRELVRAHDRRIEALEAERDRVDRLLAEGRAARVTRLRAEAALGRAGADRAEAVAALEVAERGLARLMGAEPGTIRGRSLDPVRLRAGAAAADRASSTTRAVESNPDVRRARTRADAARASVAEARAAWLPDIRVAGGYTRYGGGAIGDLQGEWRAGIQLSFPLFAGGGRVGEAHRADAEARAAEAELAAAELHAADAVDRALADLAAASARARALADVERQAAEVARIERLALDNGAGVQTDYLAAEAELLHARAGLAEARHAVAAARIELARVTGELSREWLATNLESGS